MADQFVQTRVVQSLDHLRRAFLGVAVEEGDGIGIEVVDAAEGLAHADRPGHRRALHAEHRFDLVQQFDGRARFAVQLVDEGQDGCIAHAADVEQLDGLRLDTVDRVDDHDGGIDCCQGSISVFRKIVVARRVEQVDHVLAIRELHDRGGHRDAALLFQFHPVRSGMTCCLAATHFTGDLDRAAEPQQFFGERGFTGIRVGDDGKGAATLDFFLQGAHGAG